MRKYVVFWAVWAGMVSLVAGGLLTGIAHGDNGAPPPSGQMGCYGVPGAVLGSVTDAQTGDPIAGADVSIQDLGLYVTTDDDGLYVFPVVPPGTFSVRAAAAGYATQTVSVTVDQGEERLVSFELYPGTAEGEGEGEGEGGLVCSQGVLSPPTGTRGPNRLGDILTLCAVAAALTLARHRAHRKWTG